MLDADDIRAIAEQMAPIVARLLSSGPVAPPPPVPLSGDEAIRQRAHHLARQGKRAESIELIKSLSRRKAA